MEKENINNKIYFIVSDIHSFYDELMQALKRAGYDKKNKDHVLIVCGDIFDRGPKTKQVYKFLRSIPKSRRILIRGNHEDMFINMLKKEFPDTYDFHNKTTRTFCQLADFDERCLNVPAFLSDEDADAATEEAEIYWKQIVQIVKDMKIVEWFNSKEWVDYYEMDRFIFVHSFIPLTRIPNPPFNDDLAYNLSWRTNTTALGFEQFRWGCPWKFYLAGYFQQEEDKGKTLVCGHWNVIDFHKYLKQDYSESTNIYFSKGIIGLDGGVYTTGTGYYHPCNVLVIEDGKCYDKYGDELQEPKRRTIVYTTSVGEENGETNEIK